MRGLRGQLKRACASSALALTALLIASAPAGAVDISFCAFGTGPGQCNDPNGVAIDRTNGRVYVADAGNDRVNVFDESGAFLTSFGSAGAGAGQFTDPRRIAVDNNPLSPSFHDVYVADSNKRVQRFSPTGTFELTIGAGQLARSNPPIAVGPGGDLYAIDQSGSESVLRIFEPDAVTPTGSSALGTQVGGTVAVDSGGNVYVVAIAAIEIREYDPTEPAATLIDSFATGITTSSLGLGSDGSLYAAQRQGPAFITKYDSSNAIVKRFGYGKFQLNLQGLAVDAAGNAYGSEEFFAGSTAIGNKVVRIEQPPPGPLACCLTTTPRNTSATLKGGVNPEGKATTYHFEYLTEADYAANGNSFSGPKPVASTPESASVGSDFNLYQAEAQIGCAKVEVPAQPTCLKPDTAYRYRLVATNADGKAEAEGSFTTQPPLEIEEVFATDVGIDAGRLHAVVNPLGIPATGYLEYVDDAAYQADLAEGPGHDGFAQAIKVPDIDAGQAPLSFGAGEAGKELARELTGLEPDTAYHYRVIASNPFMTVEGDESVFTTFPLPTSPSRACPNAQFRTAASAALPECRAYEMVSPVDKNGNDIKVLVNIINFPARLDQSSADGNRFTYSSSTAFGDAVSAPWSSQYLATRKEGVGWSTRSLNAPLESAPLTDQYAMKLDAPYKLFDPELANGWLNHVAEPPLDECASPGFLNLYRRDNTTGEYEALIPSEPLSSNLTGYRLELQGASADGTRTVFRANAKLTGDAANTSGLVAYQLYEHVADEGCGELRLVSYQTNGKASPLAASAGTPRGPAEYREGMMARSVSADGSRVFFTLESIPASRGPLYVRVNADQEQSPVSKGECTDLSLGCTLEVSASEAQFWTAATDGSRAIYSVGDNLFEFDVDKALAGEAASTLIAGGAGVAAKGGVAAANEDASRIYIVSTEEIDGEGEQGERNLYLYEPGKSGPERYRLVATLDNLPGHNLWGFEIGTPFPIKNGVRVTADGGHLAFVSPASITGYDNADAVDGRPALEVYLYDATTEDVRCISCNPSNARPRGREFVEGVDSLRVSAMMAPAENQLFAPRALSADGNRLFFESFEALLPRDTNGKADVYEWQRASGEEACEEAGAELYVPTAGGCLSLISSGQSPVDSELADASPDGHDVFIRTQSSLLPQDDGLIDVYDARINGGFAQPPLPPAACEGEACQGPLSAPDDPTPASSAFEGAGNVKEEPLASCRKGKVRRKGRCVPRKSRKAQKAQKAKAQKKQKRKAR